MRVAAVLQKIMEFYEPIYKIHDAWPIESALPRGVYCHPSCSCARHDACPLLMMKQVSHLTTAVCDYL